MDLNKYSVPKCAYKTIYSVPLIRYTKNYILNVKKKVFYLPFNHFFLSDSMLNRTPVFLDHASNPFFNG
jgi:hypothetical protein